MLQSMGLQTAGHDSQPQCIPSLCRERSDVTSAPPGFYDAQAVNQGGPGALTTICPEKPNILAQNSCCSGDEKLHQHRQFPLPCKRTI